MHYKLARIANQLESLDHDMSNIDPIEFGRMQADVHTLKADMVELKNDVRALLEMANTGKGGLWMFRTMYVAAGGLVAWALPTVVEKLK